MFARVPIVRVVRVGANGYGLDHGPGDGPERRRYRWSKGHSRELRDLRENFNANERVRRVHHSLSAHRHLYHDHRGDWVCHGESFPIYA